LSKKQDVVLSFTSNDIVDRDRQAEREQIASVMDCVRDKLINNYAQDTSIDRIRLLVLGSVFVCGNIDKGEEKKKNKKAKEQMMQDKQFS
jgi:hypothetical protein